MCIYQPEEIPGGASQNNCGRPSGRQHAAFAIAIVGKKDERDYANLALTMHGLVGLSLLIADRSTAAVAVLAVLNLAVLLYRRGLDRISRTSRHG